MTKHTKGPWTIENEIELGPEIFVFGVSELTGDPYCVCELRVGTPMCADANLIAAAPDLLKAVKAALKQSLCDGDLCSTAWHDLARAAISRAEGGE